MILEILGLLTLGFIISYVFFFYFHKKQEKTVRTTTIKKLQKFGLIKEDGKKISFTMGAEIFEILFFKLPVKTELIINSPTIWEAFRFGSSELIDQKMFLSSNKHKIIILYPATEVVKRYLNENELVFVKPTDIFYKMQLVRMSELDLFLKSKQKECQYEI